MSDLLIPSVDDGDVRAIDRQAKRLGLSRSEFFRQETRKIERHSDVSARAMTREHLRRATELVQAALDDDIMNQAWG